MEDAIARRYATFSDDWKLRAYRKRAIRIDVSGPTTLDIRLRTPLPSDQPFCPGPARDHLLASVDVPGAFLAALGTTTMTPGPVT